MSWRAIAILQEDEALTACVIAVAIVVNSVQPQIAGGRGYHRQTLLVSEN